MGELIGAGDRVKVMFMSCPSVSGVIIHKPCDVGDSWQMDCGDRTLAFMHYECMVRLNDGDDRGADDE